MAILVAERQILFLDSLRPDGFGDDLYQTIFRRVAAFIDPGSWVAKTGRDLEFFPQQFSGNRCGIFMMMYALCICTSSPLTFTEVEIPAIRQWWCVQLMERFCTEGHGHRLAFWTEEASLLLKGSLQPVFRVPKVTTSKPSARPNRQVEAEADCCLIEKEGDAAIFKLALVCSMFRDLVSTEYFRRRAHFNWLHSVCTWSRFSEDHREQFFKMYSIEICQQCGDQYKHCPPGYVGTGKRGELRAFYSEEMPPDYCSQHTDKADEKFWSQQWDDKIIFSHGSNPSAVNSNCRPKLTYCPTCREKTQIHQEPAMEKVANSVLFPCKYASSGCEVRLPHADKTEHEELCEFRPYSCPCPGASCKWKGSLDAVMPHLMHQHKSIIRLQGDNIVFLATDINMPGEVDWVMMQSCFGFHFMVVLEKNVRDQLFFATVQLIGTRKQAENFVYRLELNGHLRRLTWEATPHSMDEGIDTAVVNGDCLIFNTSTAQLFTEDGNLGIRVTILERGDDR